MDERKYKQRGYQQRGPDRDAARRESPSPAGDRPRGPRPDPRERPRGRGLGAPTEAIFRCARCGEPSPVGLAAAAESRCPKCGSDLHTCSNCTAFDPGARFECRREIPARVAPKDRANRCELFDPRLRQEFAQEKPREGNDPRAAFDALFKI